MKVSNTTLRGMAVELNKMYNNPTEYHCNYVVLLMWKSPIGNYIDARTGAFQTYMEAQEYADYLNHMYSGFSWHACFRISINGEELYENNFYSVLNS